RIVNPLLVDGQRLGGIVQGLGQAWVEEIRYDESGQLLTGTLMDYAMPRAHMFPRIELDTTCTPTPLNPLGAKGVGELGTIGSAPGLVSPGLDEIGEVGDRIVLGARVTHAAIAASPVLAGIAVLREAAHEIGDTQVRNRGTIGGSIVHADPAADWPAVFLALDGEARVVG